MHVQKSNDNYRWLETHLWHSKRMTIQTLWGYRMPMYHNGRGLRALRGILKSHCIIHDSSYLRPIQLKGNKTNVLNLLLQYVVRASHIIQHYHTYYLCTHSGP